MATVFLDGSMVEAADARISAFDAGFQHGVGLFETMTGGVDGGGSPWVLHLEEHLERLAGSATELGLVSTLRLADLADAVLRTVERENLSKVRVRLTISGGDLNLLSRAAADGPGREVHPTLMIVAQPATEYPDAMFTSGVMVVLADWKANPLDPFCGHKTLNYWPRLRELRAAAGKGAAEALVFQVTNHLAGGCVSNAILISKGRALTPMARGEEPTGGGVAVPSPVLPGVTREWALEWLGSRRMAVERRLVTIEDVLASDEVLLTNSSWGVLPVVRVEGHMIGKGAVGEIGRQMTGAWNQALLAAGS
ncbi:MAG: Branched-chain-amino-acid aminotransferase [Phycisphaerales bacterium]|nr:Branched-chain-amino-acid aminotransferase [Phycisphaerales bacterium]